MTDQPKSMDGQDWCLLSVLWGGAYFFAGVAVREVPPLTMVLARVALAALALLPLLWIMGHRLPRTLSDWMPFAGMGLFNNVLPFGFIFSGQLFITVGMSSIINAMTPLFTVMVMAAFREERLTAMRLIGVLLGLLGVAVLRGIDEDIGGPETIGILLGMAGAVSYGVAALWGRRQLLGVAPLKSACCQLLASTVIIAAVVAVIDQPWTLLIPITAIALGAAFLDEPIRAQEILGAVIIGCGLAFIDGRPIRWARGLLGKSVP